MKAWMTLCCAAVALALPAAAAEKAAEKKAAKKRPAKIEKLACRLGTEDEHARIAVQLADGKVDSFAYYSKWKPRTCSMDVKRHDAFSRWEDTGNTTVVTLIEDKGAFLIDHGKSQYHFIFRDIDRMRYCGMEGKVNGTLTIYRGKAQCEVTGVMDREIPVATKLEVTPPPVNPDVPTPGPVIVPQVPDPKPSEPVPAAAAPAPASPAGVAAPEKPAEAAPPAKPAEPAPPPSASPPAPAPAK